MLTAVVSMLLTTQPVQAESLQVTVDSGRHEVVLSVGPFHVPAMSMDHEMMGHDMMDHGMAHDSPLARFDWPVEGWLRGFRIEVLDSLGRPAARRLLHHLIVINFARRQLLYPAYERVLGAGAETADVMLPKTVGIPVRSGMPFGLYAGWHNESGADLDGIRLRLTVIWMPRNQNPPPVDVLPFYADVNLDIGGSNTFDIPPGRSAKSYAFTVPVSGRLLGVGGHLHDLGESVRLEEDSTSRVLTELRARRDSAGHVEGLERRLFGVSGAGLRLRAGRGYRVVGLYDNPSGETRRRGAMASMVGLFAPDRLDRWPALDPDSPELARDLAALSPPPAEARAP